MPSPCPHYSNTGKFLCAICYPLGPLTTIPTPTPPVPTCPRHGKPYILFCPVCRGSAGGRKMSAAQLARNRAAAAAARLCPLCRQPASERAPAGCPAHLV